MDGGELGGLEYENFNAANAVITFHGRSVHTGSAKGKMKNALTLAGEWQAMLPAGEKPEYTEGREGFFHVYGIQGSVETCRMDMLIRDHHREKFQARKALLEKMAEFFNAKYGAGSVEVSCHDVYYNMLSVIEDGHMDVVERAKKAMEKVGVTPVISPIRGGTDGAVLIKGCPARTCSQAAPISTAGSNTCPCRLWKKPAKPSSPLPKKSNTRKDPPRLFPYRGEGPFHC